MDLELNNARSSNIKNAAAVPSYHPSNQGGLGKVEQQRILKSTYSRIMEATQVFVIRTSKVAIGEVHVNFHAVSFQQLPQPVKRHIVQLKCSQIELPNTEYVSDIRQFIGNIEDEYLYLVEHPENIFLAHFGRIIAYSKP